MRAQDLMLALEIGAKSPEDLTLDQMNQLYHRYGRNWWKFESLNFNRNPLYYDTDGEHSPRKRPW